jgi:hypothetical protein
MLELAGDSPSAGFSNGDLGFFLFYAFVSVHSV